MKKVVIDARESGTSTGRYIDKLIENLHQLKPDIDFAILVKTHRRDFIKEIAPDFEIRLCNIPEFSFAEQYSYVWKLYGIKNDLVHFGMIQQPILYFGPTITTIHDLTTLRFRNPATPWLVFKFKQLVYRWVIKRVARKSLLVITPSQFVKDDLVQFSKINPKKIIVTHEAADRIEQKPKPLKQLQGQKYLLYVGRAQPHKNLDQMVKAFSEVRVTHPGLKLVLVGKKDVQHNQLERRIKKRGYEGVVFTDFVSEAELRWLYENCQAYVFASLSEGFGLPPLEAMMHGAPVISSNASCLPEINGDGALYFNPTDTSDMAQKMGQILDDDILRQKLIKKGRAQAAKYSWRKMAEQTIEVYKKAIEAQESSS